MADLQFRYSSNFGAPLQGEVLQSRGRSPRTLHCHSREIESDCNRAPSSSGSREQGDADEGVGKEDCLENSEGKLRYAYNISLGRNFALPDSDYNPESWFGTVLALNGSVLPEVANRTLLWAGYAYLVFSFQRAYPEALVLKADVGPKVFSSLAIFFTIFRLSSAHARYRDGVLVYERCVDCLRSIIRKIVSYMDKKGTPALKPEEVHQANHSKLDMLRFTLLTGVLIKLQGRLSHVDEQMSRSLCRLIELDMMRIRGLLYEGEFKQLQKVLGWTSWTKVPKRSVPMRAWLECEDLFEPPFKQQYPVQNWGIQRLSRAVGVACFHKDIMVHGFVERMLNLFEENLQGIEASGNSMLNAAIIPVPVSYVQMARLLLIMFLLVLPCQVPSDEGVFANIFFPVMISLIFNCMDQICTNMEDPHGDDPSDLKLVTPLQNVESEMMTQLEEIADPVHDMFVWRFLPPGDEWLTPRGVTRYLCLRTEIDVVEALEAEVRTDSWAE